jgi:hypothetical protein
MTDVSARRRTQGQGPTAKCKRMSDRGSIEVGHSGTRQSSARMRHGTDRTH